jgi:hypothetical protein
MGNKEYKHSDVTKHVYAQCKVVVYPWTNPLNESEASEAKLSSAFALEISSQITSVTFSKNMGSAAGSFSINLVNSPNYGTNDWKDIIKRGYWLVVYMSNEGDLKIGNSVGAPQTSKEENKRIRCVGYVERVAVNGTTEANGSIDIGFTVTGRDFGIVYEETQVWHNMFQYDKIILDNIAQTKLNITGNARTHEAIKLIHDLFYYPLNLNGQAKVNDKKSLVSIGLQWLLPKEMLADIGFNMAGLSNGTYWGALPGVADLIDNGGSIGETGSGIAVDRPGDYLSGNAWEQLKKISIPQFHELFTEITDEGLPRLIFRPIPWGIDNSKYPKNAKNITLYKDIEDIVTIPAIDLYSFDLGEDEHARYNSFIATVSTTMFNTEDNISLLLNTGYPRNNFASIKRHGFRPMHVSVDSIIKNEELGNAAADKQQLLEFNEILFDYWNNSIFAESGTVDILGNSEVKLGKVMKFKDDVPYLSTKRYYIEGYQDTFQIEENRAASWTQSISLTRGFEEADLLSKSNFQERNVPFTGPGEFTKGDGES